MPLPLILLPTCPREELLLQHGSQNKNISRPALRSTAWSLVSWPTTIMWCGLEENACCYKQLRVWVASLAKPDYINMKMWPFNKSTKLSKSLFLCLYSSKRKHLFVCLFDFSHLEGVWDYKTMCLGEDPHQGQTWDLRDSSDCQVGETSFVDKYAFSREFK